MPKRGLGYRIDPPDRRDLNIDALGLSVIDLPDECSLEKYVGEVFDQRNTNSCVANAVAGAIGILERKSNISYKPVSRLFAYYNSRRLHGDHLVDKGTYIRLCVKMMTKLGIPDEEHWPFSTSFIKLRRRPPWNAYMMAHPRKNGSYYKIFDVGDERVNAIKAAIHAGYPVVFGTDVSEYYLNSSGPTTVSKPASDDPIAGGHAQVIVGYHNKSALGTEFRVLNSWGDGWRDDGYIWIAEDYIIWNRTRDLQIIKGWSRLQQSEGIN